MGGSVAAGGGPGGEDPQARSHTRVELFKPVRLFSDDIDELNRLLKALGKTEISTDKALLSDCTQVRERLLPVRWLCLSVPEVGVSVMALPRQAEARWSCDWNPSVSEANAIVQVRKLVGSRRHPFYFLGERGWQLVAVFFASTLFLPAAVSYLQQEGSSDVLRAAGIVGIFIGAITGAIASLGMLLPSRSRVTLYAMTREQFRQKVRRIILYVVGGTIIWFCGFAAALAAVRIGHMRGF